MFKSLSSHILVKPAASRFSSVVAELECFDATSDVFDMNNIRRRSHIPVRPRSASVTPRLRPFSDIMDSPRRSFAGEDLDMEMQIVRLNVGGSIFHITRNSLRRYPDTFLGSLTPASPYFNRRRREYFFDRNPVMFNSILDLYRTNELHLPRNVCGNAARRELEFWNIPSIWVSGCCWSNLHDVIHDQRLHQDLKTSTMTTDFAQSPVNAWRSKLWNQFYDCNRPSKSYTLWNNVITMVIVTTLVLFFIDSATETPPRKYFNTYLSRNGSRPDSESIPSRRLYGVWLADVITLGVLTTEFLFKMAVCTHLKYFCTNFVNILYGLSLLACVIGHIVEWVLEKPRNWVSEKNLDGIYVFLRCAHFLRMVRFFELLDRNASLSVVWVATLRCKTELLLLLAVFTILAIFFGTLTFFCETLRDEQSEDGKWGQKSQFADSLAASLYWAIITMTTVGYGDITPQTPVGRVVGSVCSLCGVILLAMPIAILTESFQQYNVRQKIRLEKRQHQEDFLRARASMNTLAHGMVSL